MNAPISLSPGRIRLYAIGLFLIGLAQIRFAKTTGAFWDWSDFWAAGSTVGTKALADPVARAAWGAAHHFSTVAFTYVPATAWLYLPAGYMPLAAGFTMNAVLMGLALIVAGLLAARTYGLSRQFALLATLAWAPGTAAVVTGQNSPIGLVLALVAIDSLARKKAYLGGIAIGALLYKPTYALPFILLLIVQRRFRSLAIVLGCACLWYIGSVSATAGDWVWPLQYARSLHAYFINDFAYNAAKALSVPSLLLRLGVPATIAFGLATLLLLAAIVRLNRSEPCRAASLTCFVGVAMSAHAWPYDAVLMLPAILLTLREWGEPWRTRLFAGSYCLASLWIVSNYLKFNPMLLITIAGPIAWLLLIRKRHSVPTRGEYADPTS